MKKVLGYLILSLPFLLVFICICITCGDIVTILYCISPPILFAIFVVGCVHLGSYLIGE